MLRTLKLQRGSAGQVVTWDAPAPIDDGGVVTFTVHRADGDVSAVMARTPAGSVTAVDAARRSLTVEFDATDDSMVPGPAWLGLESVEVFRVSLSPDDPPPGKRLDVIALAQPLPRPISTPLRLETSRFSVEVPAAAVAADGVYAWSVDWPGAAKPAPASGTLRVSLRPFSTGVTPETVKDLVAGADAAVSRRPRMIESQIDAAETLLVQRIENRGLDAGLVAGARFTLCHAYMVGAALERDLEQAAALRKKADAAFEAALPGAWSDMDKNGRVDAGETDRKAGSADLFAPPTYGEPRHCRSDW